MGNNDIPPLGGKNKPYDSSTPPNWQSEGVEPPESLKQQGFVAGYKPPAAYFNWFWKAVSDCLDEIYTNAAGKATFGNYGNRKGEVFNEYNHNEASGDYSHAEGYFTTASGDYSHAGGNGAAALGRASFAHGEDVVANDHQTVFGQYNEEVSDNKNAIFLLGNGTEMNRSNAVEVYKDGTMKAFGKSIFPMILEFNETLAANESTTYKTNIPNYSSDNYMILRARSGNTTGVSLLSPTSGGVVNDSTLTGTTFRFNTDGTLTVSNTTTGDITANKVYIIIPKNKVILTT